MILQEHKSMKPFLIFYRFIYLSIFFDSLKKTFWFSTDLFIYRFFLIHLKKTLWFSTGLFIDRYYSDLHKKTLCYSRNTTRWNFFLIFYRFIYLSIFFDSLKKIFWFSTDLFIYRFILIYLKKTLWYSRNTNRWNLFLIFYRFIYLSSFFIYLNKTLWYSRNTNRWNFFLNFYRFIYLLFFFQECHTGLNYQT